MAKIWKYVAIAAAAILLIGAVCIGVGFLTGASPLRIVAKFVQHYDVQSLIEQLKAMAQMPII